MSQAKLELDRVHVGDRFSFAFHRTLRLPDDGREYPLPAGLGRFPIHRVEDYPEAVFSRKDPTGFFIPMYQREALWIGFGGVSWHPNAVKVGVGGVNAVSGGAWGIELHDDPQDYIVCPDQPWLDGINIGEGLIRQFVATPLGQGATIEGQVAGEEKVGGIQIAVFEARPGRFPEEEPPRTDLDVRPLAAPLTAPAELGLGAGGLMRQKIYPDPYGLGTWNETSETAITIFIVNSDLYKEVTGYDPPPTPISIRSYEKQQIPWFDLYDEERGDLAASEALSMVRTVQDIEGSAQGEERQEELEVDESRVKMLRPSDHEGGKGKV